MSKANLTRTDGSLKYNELDEVVGSMIANIGYNNGEEVVNDFDALYPWSGITEVTDSAGNVWIRIPVFYTWYEVVDGVVKGRKISEYKIDDEWFLNPLFVRDGRVLPYVDIAKYLTSFVDGQVWSRSGDAPMKGVTPSTARSRMETLSSEDYQISSYDIWAVQLLQDLFSIEFGTTKCQAIMKGYIYKNYSAKSANNGTTDTIPYATGCITEYAAVEGTQCIKYRGIENIWGNGSLFVDGIRTRGLQVFICKEPALYADNNNYVTSNLTGLTTSGVIYQFGCDPDNHFLFPIAVDNNGAYENTYSKLYTDAEGCMYSGNNNENIGLFTYNLSAAYSSYIPQSVFRMIRRPK